MKKGFTLVELLVVIAIIAILAAVIFPVFARAREKARQSNCLSNVKQLTTAILMYAGDHDETLPRQGQYLWDSGNSDPISWYLVTMKYYDDEGVMRCPSRRPAVGYQASCRSMGYPLGEFSKPSKTVIITDGFGVSWGQATGTRIPSNAYWWPAPCGNAYSSACPLRHNGGVNCGFVDGHAKWIEVSENPANSGYGFLAYDAPSTFPRWWP